MQQARLHLTLGTRDREDRAMAGDSAIEWTDATWNPWMGCEKVSPGCAHCYMYREQRQYGHDPTAIRRSKTKFRDPLVHMLLVGLVPSGR